MPGNYPTLLAQLQAYKTKNPDEFPITVKDIHTRIRPDVRYGSLRSMIFRLLKNDCGVSQVGFAKANGPGRPPALYDVV